MSEASWRRKYATSSCFHSASWALASRPNRRRVASASFWRVRSSRSAECGSPPSTRRVTLYRSSSSLAFQAFHTLGLVPRMSATVRRYSAVRWRSSLTTAAKAWITSGSDRSCFCATVDMVRCCSTRNTTSSVSSIDMPWSRQNPRASIMPSLEWSPPRPLAMSWNRAATYSSQRSWKSAISWLQNGYSCACSGIVKRRRLRITIMMCWSTVYTWNRSCCIWPTILRKAGR